MEPIKSYVKHMASALIDGRMQKTMQHLKTVVCYTDFMHVKVLDSINYLQATSQGSKTHAESDSCLSAVFLGINQGKMLVKDARAWALESQAETGHLAEITKGIAEVTKFMEDHPDVNAASFDWKGASELGSKTQKLLQDAQSQASAANSAKVHFGNARKAHADFVIFVCKGFTLGPFQRWLIDWMDNYAATSGFMEAKPASLSSMENLKSKLLTTDAFAVLELALDTSKFIEDFVSLVASATSADSPASAVVDLMKTMEHFESSVWTRLTFMRITESVKVINAFNGLKDATAKIVANQLSNQINAAAQSMGNILAKANLC